MIYRYYRFDFIVVKIVKIMIVIKIIGIIILISVVLGLGCFIYSIKNAPLYPDDL